jgi:hypothetical protein
MSLELIQSLTRKISSNMRVAMPATIEAYDFKTQKASVKIDMQEAYGEDSLIDYPVLTNVPVIFPRSGAASLTMPVVRGDTCLVLFFDRDMTSWLLGAKAAIPKSKRYHDLNDAVVIMGLSPFSTPSPAKNNTDVLLTYHGSNLVLKPNGEIDINSAEKLNIKTKDIDIDCANANIKASGDVSIDVAKSISIKAQDVVINCTNANIKATGKIETESPSFTQKGKMIIDGDIEVTGKSSLKGNTTCDGTIKGAAVKTSSGIDLATHKHTYNEAQAGSNPTIVTPSITGGAT